MKKCKEILIGVLVAYGLERVKLFSWEQTARQLLALYESLGR